MYCDNQTCRSHEYLVTVNGGYVDECFGIMSLILLMPWMNQMTHGPYLPCTGFFVCKLKKFSNEPKKVAQDEEGDEEAAVVAGGSDDPNTSGGAKKGSKKGCAQESKPVIIPVSRPKVGTGWAFV